MKLQMKFKYVEYTIEYTSKLPIDKGYKTVDFDGFTNKFGNDQVEYRGL